MRKIEDKKISHFLIHHYMAYSDSYEAVFLSTSVLLPATCSNSFDKGSEGANSLVRAIQFFSFSIDW